MVRPVAEKRDDPGRPHVVEQFRLRRIGTLFRLVAGCQDEGDHAMTEIPNDIMETATDVARSCVERPYNKGTVARATDKIAHALLAKRDRYILEQIESGSVVTLGKALELVQAAAAKERERCARLADMEEAAFCDPRIAGSFHSRGSREAAVRIAAAIRRGDAP